MSKTTLDNISTKELVEELIKREGVETTKVLPESENKITVKGPAVVLVVID